MCGGLYGVHDVWVLRFRVWGWGFRDMGFRVWGLAEDRRSHSGCNKGDYKSYTRVTVRLHKGY